MSRCLSAFLLASAVSLGGCRVEQTWVTPDPHLERMLTQQKRLAYSEDPMLPGGMAMQAPPPGTLPVDAIAGDPIVSVGAAHDRWAERIPTPIDRQAIERGRGSFDRLCAACHGILGDGVSVVADKMNLRKPPSLHEARIRAYPPGRVFRTIREGYGLMPSYAVQLSIPEAWEVVAYVRALQLARGARVADLPPDVRDRLAKEAP
ncbi:MAG TPA: cytochrome c [Polyangiaceae bacterium]|nr:cytochrome c [Polyangiaceae bacterium]